MTSYYDHNDSKGRAERLRAHAHQAERARQARATADYDAGCVTLWMPKHELQTRLREAHRRALATRLIREVMAELGAER